MTRLAALDLGSNSFHLLVAESLAGGRIERVVTRKLRLRLAEPIMRDGELGSDGRKRARAAVAELLDVAREARAEQVVAVATDALRRAADGKRLVDRLERDHGLRVQILDGMQEAALSLRGMAAALRQDGPMLGFDLGGGSFEIAYGALGGAVTAASLPLGGARVTARWQHDPPRLAERAAVHEEVLTALAPIAAEVAERHGHEPLRAVGTAGTIRDVGRLGLALAAGIEVQRVRGLVVTREQLEVAVARIMLVPTAERLDLPAISASRVDLLPAGGLLLLAAMEVFGLEQLQLCDWGLREGAVLDALDGPGIVDAAAAAKLV